VSVASFDSNILIDSLNANVAAQAELESIDERWISRLTWIEVMSKVDGATLAATTALLSGFYIDEVSIPIAERAAVLRNLRHSLKLPDAVILASAQVNGRVLVTRNTRDFRPGVRGIRIPPYSL